MGHNVHRHIEAVQEANRRYSNGERPEMMNASYMEGKRFRQYELHYFAEVIDAIFATSDKGKALALIEHYKKYFARIIGTRGNKGDDLINPDTFFHETFEFEGMLGIEKVVKVKAEPTKPILNPSLFEE
jgi:hypothetical protein